MSNDGCPLIHLTLSEGPLRRQRKGSKLYDEDKEPPLHGQEDNLSLLRNFLENGSWKRRRTPLFSAGLRGDPGILDGDELSMKTWR